MKNYFTIEMKDGSLWGVPVEMIARNRAEYYAHEFDNDVEKSLKEDTLPLFEEDEYEIKDWAVNNMDWEDFNGFQIQIVNRSDDFYQEGWLEGDKGLINIFPPNNRK